MILCRAREKRRSASLAHCFSIYCYQWSMGTSYYRCRRILWTRNFRFKTRISQQCSLWRGCGRDGVDPRANAYPTTSRCSTVWVAIAFFGCGSDGHGHNAAPENELSQFHLLFYAQNPSETMARYRTRATLVCQDQSRPSPRSPPAREVPPVDQLIESIGSSRCHWEQRRDEDLWDSSFCQPGLIETNIEESDGHWILRLSWSADVEWW
jgi:hypothetical protein